MGHIAHLRNSSNQFAQSNNYAITLREKRKTTLSHKEILRQVWFKLVSSSREDDFKFRQIIFEISLLSPFRKRVLLHFNKFESFFNKECLEPSLVQFTLVLLEKGI